MPLEKSICFNFVGLGRGGEGGVGRGVLRSVIGKTESGGGIRSNPFIGCT